MESVDVYSVEDLVARVKADTQDWTHDGFVKPWFRGHTNVEYELVPSILRKNNAQHEFDLTKKFRLMAPGYGPTPETDRLDRWLFLMQHHGAPTRLLDWTESVLVAAFFALPPAIQAQPPHAGFPLEPQAQHATALILICDATALQDQLWHDRSLL